MINSPGGGKSEKSKKGDGSMVKGQDCLKEGWGWHFPVSFFQGLSFLHLEITVPFAKLCYVFEEKLFFSATTILGSKVIVSCLKMNLKISHKLR